MALGQLADKPERIVESSSDYATFKAYLLKEYR